MKNSVKYIAIAWLLLATGCRQEVFVADDGETLTVRIADEAVQTRTSFSNFDGMFKWDENDQIKVHYADGRFETKTINVDGDDPSVGTVLSSTAGSKLRDFFAVFPASSAVDPGQGDAAPKVTLPSSYDISEIVAGTSTLTLDHVPTPMVAKNIPGEDLQFHHVGGLLRISLKDLKDSDAGMKRVRITFDRGVTGTFPVNVDDPDQPYIDNTALTGGNNIVTFEVASSASGIGAGVTTLLLNIPVPCGTYREITIEALDNGGNVLFTRTHTEPELVFERAHGKRLSADEIDLDFFLGMDEYQTERPYSYQGGVVDLFQNVISYKSDGTTLIPEPIHLEYSETGEEGTWSTTAPDWLSLGAGSDLQGGLDGSAVNLAIAPQKNEIDPRDDSHTIKLSGRPSVSDFDLSKINVATGEGIQTTTANCYVVQAPGTYRFPVVYGNAIKDNKDNPYAYHATINPNDPYDPDEDDSVDDYVQTNGLIWKGDFTDHLDRAIKKPYIAQQLAPSLSIREAKLLWMDAPGLITQVEHHSGAEGKDYITFKVDSKDICQGNAVIGVFDNLGRVAWSWHIWVTDADLTLHNTGYDGLTYSQINLGWCDKKDVAKYSARSYYVRIAQDDPDGVVSSGIHIKTDAGPTISYFGNSPYYQGNRKDPLFSWKGTGLEKKEYWAADGFFPTIGGAVDNPSMADYIQNPHLHFRTTVMWVNAWNTWKNNYSDHNEDNDRKQGIKTIYDPCPVGFKLPQNYNTEPLASGSSTGSDKVIYVSNPPFDMDEGNFGIVYQDKLGNDEFFPLLGYIDSAGGLSGIGSECHFWCGGGAGNWNGTATGDRFTLKRDYTIMNHGATVPQGLSVRPMFE